ncbi:MAG: hypothetical protein GC179_28625 [Anaerolineaceae bacterium]|nr:hypothetical protein [Anaerolineaceae bacterium]
MLTQLGFVAEWWIATVIGVIVGTFLGANHIGLVQNIPGDLLFGLSIGLAQLPVLYRYLPQRDNRLLLWAAATAVAFPIGVVLGRRIANQFAPSISEFDFYFGIGMGLGHGIIQAVAIRLILPAVQWRLLIWIPFALAGWISAEVVSLGIDYTMALAIPVGLALAIATGFGWLLIFKPTRVHSPMIAVTKDGYRTTD